MKLSSLLKGVKTQDVYEERDVERVTDKDNEKLKNALFVCIDGNRCDGHSLAQKAIEKGALEDVTVKQLKDCLSVYPYVQGDVNDALVAIVNQLEGLDVALVQQDLSNSLLQVGSRDIHGFVLRRVRVTDSGQHICYGIGDLHVNILLLEVTGLTR